MPWDSEMLCVTLKLHDSNKSYFGCWHAVHSEQNRYMVKKGEKANNDLGIFAEICSIFSKY